MATFSGLLVRNLTTDFRYRPLYLKLLNAPMTSVAHRAEHSTPSPELQVSDSCVRRLKQIASNGTVLRVLVEGGGCSGFQYKFELVKDIQDDDITLEKDGAKVVIDETSLSYIRGSTVDYHEELIRSAFRITNNPLAEQGCSCGASFALKLD